MCEELCANWRAISPVNMSIKNGATFGMLVILFWGKIVTHVHQFLNLSEIALLMLTECT